MHTTRGKTAIFFHNGDFSGDVRISMPSGRADMAIMHNERTIEMVVPMEDLEQFVLEKFRQEALAEIEGLDLSTLRGRWALFSFMSARQV